MSTTKAWSVMTEEEKQYAEFVLSRFKTHNFATHLDIPLHAVLGIAGEAGEIVDAFKKSWAYNKPLDLENLIEELGDLEFYMEALRRFFDLSRQQILDANVAKLTKRYSSGGYSDAEAQARADKISKEGA